MTFRHMDGMGLRVLLTRRVEVLDILAMHIALIQRPVAVMLDSRDEAERVHTEELLLLLVRLGRASASGLWPCPGAGMTGRDERPERRTLTSW